MPIPPIASIGIATSPDAIAPLPPLVPVATPSGSFANLLTSGIDGVNSKVLDADRLARAFALDDSIPLHQVTYALEQARLSLDVMMQVRSRMIDAYQQLMNMQL
jgi:flagellar hook-basal body complex protein FliE